MAEPRSRRLSLDELQRDLAQVAPVHNDSEFDALADALRTILAEPRDGQSPDAPRTLNKQAVWARVQDEIDRLAEQAYDEADEADEPDEADDDGTDVTDLEG